MVVTRGTWILRRKPRRQALDLGSSVSPAKAYTVAWRGCHGTHRPLRLRLTPTVYAYVRSLTTADIGKASPHTR
jgi:hypothetical protein